MSEDQYFGLHLTGIHSILGDVKIRNEEVIGDEAAAFENRTGIRDRYIVSDSVNIKDYFQKAIQKLMESQEWQTSEVDILICVTQTPDIPFPSLSNRLAGALNFSTSTYCIDLNIGCSGYPYALDLVSKLTQNSTVKKNAIVCVGDFSSRLMGHDLSLKPIFSDAVSATAITYFPTNKANVFTDFLTIGAEHKAIEAVKVSDGFQMKMNGLDVFNASYKFVPQSIGSVLQKAEMKIDDVEFFVFHQANKMLTEALRRQMNLTEDKVPYSIDKFGNTAIASIPLTLQENCVKFTVGDALVLCGFGVGFSVGTILIRWSDRFKSSTIEIG